MTAELPKIGYILGGFIVTALSCQRKLDVELMQLSDENIVEVYVKGILNKCDNNLIILEKEILKRKLFLVALDRFEILTNKAFEMDRS